MLSVRVVAPLGRVMENKSANTALPKILKSSTRNVFEIFSLSVAKKVAPISPNHCGRLESPVMLYCARFSVFGVAGSGPGGHPLTRGFQFLPVKFSTKVKSESLLL